MRCLQIALVVLAAILAMPCRGNDPTPPAWRLTGTGHTYHLDSKGDPTAAGGATITLRSAGGDPAQFGGSLLALDATPYRGRRVTLSGDFTTQDASNGAALWLRADGAKGPLAFVNSQMMPVLGNASDVHREVRIDVPKAAVWLALGIFLEGNGSATAQQLRLTTVATPPAVPPQRVLDQAIELVRAHALHSRDINWPLVAPAIRAMAKDARVSSEVYPAIRALLKQLGDHHSSLLLPSFQQQTWSEGGPGSLASVELMSQNIGYIVMPSYIGMAPGPRRAFVSKMIDSISHDEPMARCGWVVDLRRDTGGSMLPMLAGLQPLLGNATLGGFRNADDHIEHFSAASPLDRNLPTGPGLQDAPVAVLIGPHTASSGEVVAIAFRGRPRTRSFGQPSAGLSTANSVYPLADGSGLVLTTAVDLDRNGHVYGDKLLPDQPEADAAGDSTLAAAIAWLQQAPGCQPLRGS